MKISIIMPIYNQIEFTKKAIESLYQFTDEKDFELIVIDNGSDDGTLEMLKSLYSEKKNLAIKHEIKNLGWCKGLNEGFKLISPNSNFVLWANNDILFEKDWLPKMIAHFRTGVGAVGPTSNYVHGRQRMELNDGNWEEEVQWLIGFFLMFRRGVIDAIGEVDERFGLGGSEEWDYIIRMQKQLGLKCVIARDVYIHHFGSQTIKADLAKTPEEYNQYHKEKDKILREKWGNEFINQWNHQKISSSIKEVSPWPLNCSLGFAMPLTWPYINSNTYLSHLAMKKPNMIFLDTGQGGELDAKRDLQILDGLKQGCTHFFINDADMLQPENILVDLFKVLKDGADLAGGLCYRGYPPYDPILWHSTERRQLRPFKDFKFGDIVDAGATGAACLLVKREVFEKLPRPWFHFRMEKVLNDKGKERIDVQGEDNYFTRKATEAGFKLRIFTKYDVGHVREFPVNRELWLTHGLLSRCGDWGTIMALFKKLGDKKWIEREINNASTEIDWPINQKHYEISLLYNFLLGKRIKTVLEIGTQKGGTALLWAKLVESRVDGRVYCIDREFGPNKAYDDHPLKEKIVEIEGDSHRQEIILKVNKIIQENGGFVDFLFIDGDHSFAGVKADFENFAPMVKPGGWIAFHDIFASGWNVKNDCFVAKFWNELKIHFNHFEISDPNDKSWMGIGVMEWEGKFNMA